ncbi:MAG: SDR family oxidoreductase [Nitrospira sp.]|nr:SDR family oxidoreductase [Nitrospira sp.]MDE0406165.1 SDR family oxidoreductase [Nitrospira sp.]MDE0485934.1 SDR family oxidoreductase [Nitrospira sp.]
MTTDERPGEWALVLGASSGFGRAVALELAALGMNIVGVHLDRKSTLPDVDRLVADIHARGRETLFFNVNAADAEKRREVVDAVEARFRAHGEPATIRVFLHSLAFGTLRRFVTETRADAVSKAQVEMTLDVMANSLVYWVQELLARGLMGYGGRIFAMTSAGGARVWATYGAVSAAKAALESHVRQLALELAPMGITANAIMAGVTDTPALRKIPGSDEMITIAQRKNPSGRLTTPQDVAEAIGLLSHPQSHWMTGNVICVDGGEFIVD